MKDQGCTQAGKSNEHHISALIQFQEVRRALRSLDELVDKIKGEEKPCSVEGESEKPCMPLEIFLRETPSALGELNDKIQGIIVRLSDSLF